LCNHSYQKLVFYKTINLFIMKKLTFLLFAFALVFQSKSQDAEALLKKYGDLYFKFRIENKNQIKNLPAFISIDAIKGDTVYAYVNKQNYSNLLNTNIKFIPVDKASTVKSLTMATTVAEMANWDRYPTYDVYVQMMQDFAVNYPDICRLDTIGYSQNGHLILVMKITDYPDSSENEPEFFYTSTMHGDETAGFVFMLRLIDKLLSGYNNDTEITNLVNNMEIWINPLANPDGTYNGGDNDISGATRYLADGEDPNRDFPDPSGNQHPSGEWSQETVLMMNFAEEHNFTMSANFHAGSEVANYPWDYWTSSQNTHADDTWWQYVASIYAQSAQNNSPSGYFTGVSSDGITEGGDWYVAVGTRQDYMNYYRHCREMTVELSNTKLLDSEDLNAYWSYNEEALILYMKQALYGFHGVVTNACTGEPMVAKIELVGHDRDGSEVYSSADVGDYHRPVYAGTFDILITAPGFDTVLYENQTISNNQSIELNATLNPLPLVAQYDVDSSNICNGEVTFFNTTDGSNYVEWDFGDGNTSTENAPIHIYSQGGTYNVSLLVSNSCGDTAQTSFTINVTRPNVYASDVYACSSSSVTLNASGDGDIYWYTDVSGTTAFAQGNSITVDNINSDTTFYVQSIVEGTQATGGENRINTGGSYYSSYNTHGLYFDVYQPAILVSVDMNAESDGNREIVIYDKEGNILLDTNIYLVQGIQIVTLNAELPAEDSLLIKCVTPSPDLFRNNTGTNYPYNIGSLATITTSTADLGYYYYFYNWVMKTKDCKSEIKPVNVVFSNQSPTADFTYTFSNGVYHFINNSLGATSYFWDFGDGATSTEFEPEHSYAAQGDYTVTLIAENDCGSDTAQSTITFTTNNLVEMPQLKIYPNPARSYITIKAEKEINSISVFNLQGVKVLSKEVNGVLGKINIDKLPLGTYFMKINYLDGSFDKKKVTKVE
jgi:PKD repeat protein